MGAMSVLVLAVSLAADATAVAIGRGVIARPLTLGRALRVGLLFGAFQAAMPALGFAIGARFGDLIRAVDHWIAFTLLLGLGGKMLYEARTAKEEGTVTGDPFSMRALLPLALATSIDALAVGVTLPWLGVAPVLAITAIGVVTLVMATGGAYVGERVGRIAGTRVEVLGGVLLIAIGAKVLFDHLSGAA